MQEHEAASQISDNTQVNITAPNQQRGLIHHFQQWSGLHWKQMQLWRAKGEAESAAAIFSANTTPWPAKSGRRTKNRRSSRRRRNSDYLSRGEGRYGIQRRKIRLHVAID